MDSVKVNLFISCDPADRASLDTLLKWLYPMRDEVNIWYESPPPPARPLSLPWQLLLFWYRRPDPRRAYLPVLAQQKAKAHICLFLTSYRSLSNPVIQQDITNAVERYIRVGEQYLRIFPVILNPCRWNENTRLARFKPLGPAKSLAAAKPVEDAYLDMVEKLSLVIKEMQRNLNEKRQFVAGQLPAGGNLPDIGDDPGATFFQPEPALDPPEWLGWAILTGLVVLTMARLGTGLPTRESSRFKNVEPAGMKPPEYNRENPLTPPPGDLTYPPPADTLGIKLQEPKK